MTQLTKEVELDFRLERVYNLPFQLCPLFKGKVFQILMTLRACQ